MRTEVVRPNNKAVIRVDSVFSRSFLAKFLETRVAVTFGIKEMSPKAN